MNFRERIEDNLVVWLLGTLLTGFLAGVGAYKAILETAQLEVVPRVKLEQLQATASSSRAASNESPSLANHSGEDTADSKPTDKAPAPVPPIQAGEFRISASASPFPEHYDSVRPGMKLSEAQVVLPGGKLSADFYAADLDSPIFSRVQFIAFSPESDPKIEFAVFHFRDEGARQIVISSLLKEIGNLPHRSESLGQRLRWPDVNGFDLTVEDSYNIALKEK